MKWIEIPNNMELPKKTINPHPFHGSIDSLCIEHSPNSVKSSTDHIVTPSMRMTFNPSSLKSVTSDGCAGTYDVRSRVYTNPEVIQQSIQTRTVKEGMCSTLLLNIDTSYHGSTLQELIYKVSYPYLLFVFIHSLVLLRHKRRPQVLLM